MKSFSYRRYWDLHRRTNYNTRGRLGIPIVSNSLETFTSILFRLDSSVDSSFIWWANATPLSIVGDLAPCSIAAAKFSPLWRWIYRRPWFRSGPEELRSKIPSWLFFPYWKSYTQWYNINFRLASLVTLTNHPKVTPKVFVPCSVCHALGVEDNAAFQLSDLEAATVKGEVATACPQGHPQQIQQLGTFSACTAYFCSTWASYVKLQMSHNQCWKRSCCGEGKFKG